MDKTHKIVGNHIVKMKNIQINVQICTAQTVPVHQLTLTSVTANTRFPQGTTLYHLSCSRSMYPSDLYLLMNSEMLEVRGEF